MKNKAVWLVILLLVAGGVFPASPAQAQACEYWVAPAPAGNNSNPGTFAQPWATLDYASARVFATSGANCTVWFKDGVYTGQFDPQERFSTPITFKAVNANKAILQNNGVTLELSGARNMIFEGFEFRHTGAGASPLLVSVERSGDVWSEYITFRNNIFHDSYNNDLLKILNGARFITVENNVFYNQGAGEQHMDVNSVTDVTIQDNIFFNDFAGSGRSNPGNTKHFIVIKDSNENEDGLMGSERITVRRNVFLNWQGGIEAFVQVGNDGKSYFEAKTVRVENNLMIGNSPIETGAVFGVAGARDVTFASNTVVGDMPSSDYAFRIVTKGSNPNNLNIFFYNNIWSDPTRTMGDGKFSDGPPAETSHLVLDNNLYWNGGAAIPPGDLISPLTADLQRVVANPGLNTNQAAILLPRWNGTSFLSGNTAIRQEFERLVGLYGFIPSNSPALDQADLLHAPADDILGHFRGPQADLGAYERNYSGAPTFDDVPYSHWAWKYIEAMYTAGITAGCGTSPRIYCPSASVNRAQMAVFLLRGMYGSGYTPPAPTGMIFTDVPASHWAAAWIEQLYTEGITGGCGGTLFCPEAQVNRAQMAVFLLRAEHGNGYIPPVPSGTVFTDVPASHWAAAWIEQLHAEGITGGCDAERYCPASAVTRAQMAVFLAYTFNLPLP